jgi:hypothetical protein
VHVLHDIPGVCFEVPFAIPFSSTRMIECTQTHEYVSCSWQIGPREDALTGPVIRRFGAVPEQGAKIVLKK